MNLKEQLIQDLDVFFNVDEFAQEALVGSDGPAKRIPIIFDESYKMVEVEEQFQNSIPSMLVKSKDLQHFPMGARVVLEGKGYRVAEIHPEEPGLTRVFLSET